MTCDNCGANLWTRDMLFQGALFAMKAFGLALTLFLSVLESQLVVALSWSFVLAFMVWQFIPVMIGLLSATGNVKHD